MALDIAMVAADTSRTRAYLSAMHRHRLLPSFVLVLKNTSATSLPGQARARTPAVDAATLDPIWSEADFDVAEPIEDILKRFKIFYEKAAESNINDESVITQIANRPEEVFIFSGFGGVLLRQGILGVGKKFLHVHGGYLPDFKGSTTNYYSLLSEDSMGASAIFLTREIDSGPILERKKFPSPPDRASVDHVYDSAARAKVLIDVLQVYKQHGKWDVLMENVGGETYHVIHPILKNIAILAREASK